MSLEIDIDLAFWVSGFQRPFEEPNLSNPLTGRRGNFYIPVPRSVAQTLRTSAPRAMSSSGASDSGVKLVESFKLHSYVTNHETHLEVLSEYFSKLSQFHPGFPSFSQSE